jgi:hypothetical protein
MHRLYNDKGISEKMGNTCLVPIDAKNPANGRYSCSKVKDGANK